MHHANMRRIPVRGRQMSCDPISLAIGAQAVFGSAALFTSAAGVTLFTTAATIATTAAIGFGLSYAASAIGPAGAARDSTLAGGQGISARDQGLRVPVRQPIPAQTLCIGTVFKAGALFFQRSDPPYIWLGYELASHRCGPLEQVFLNGIDVPLDTNGEPTSTPYYDGTTRYLKFSYRNGETDQAIDPLLDTDFPSLPSTFRQRGHATVVVKARYGSNDNAHKDIYGSEGNFNPLFRFQGAALPDPRAPGFDPEDESTWVFGSSNASLGLVRYLVHPWPNMRLVDPSKIDWDLVAEAADIDDKWFGKKDGAVERNHTADGVIFSTDDPLEVCRKFLSSCDGILVNERGKYHVVPGAPRQPVASIHQDMLAGGFEFQSEPADADLINIVKTEFVAPDREYNVVVGPVLRDEDAVTADGRPLETTLSLPLTLGDARAQRLAKRKLFESRGGKSLSVACTVEAADRTRFKAGNVVRVDLRDFPEVNGLYQIRRIARENGMVSRIHIDLVSWSNDRFPWHAPTDQQDFTLDDDVLDAEAA